MPEYPSRGDLRLRCTSTDSIKVINDNSYRQTTVSDIEQILIVSHRKEKGANDPNIRSLEDCLCLLSVRFNLNGKCFSCNR